jgi:hypothetical protein
MFGIKRDGDMTKQEKESRLCETYQKTNNKGRVALDRMIGKLAVVDETEIKSLHLGKESPNKQNKGELK